MVVGRNGASAQPVFSVVGGQCSCRPDSGQDAHVRRAPFVTAAVGISTFVVLTTSTRSSPPVQLRSSAARHALAGSGGDVPRILDQRTWRRSEPTHPVSTHERPKLSNALQHSCWVARLLQVVLAIERMASNCAHNVVDVFSIPDAKNAFDTPRGIT